MKSQAQYLNQYLKYAAAIIILLTTSLFIKTIINLGDQKEENVVFKILPGKDRAILTFDTGEQVALEKGNTYNTESIKSNGEKLLYKPSTNKNKESIAYNYLTIPRGGQFFVQLSDGTKVWVNSESKLKYPIHFIKGKLREVELLYGEAYFDISSSTQHEGMGFKVITKTQEVMVLGTEFNIKSYKNEQEIKTTLVEGLVKVNYNKLTEQLLPGQQSTVSSNTIKIDIKNISISEEIGWKNGVFIFKDRPLKEMMQTLSRWYNVEIVFLNKNVENMLFSGMLQRDENIVKLLSKIEKTGGLEFNITKEKIIIK